MGYRAPEDRSSCGGGTKALSKGRLVPLAQGRACTPITLIHTALRLRSPGLEMKHEAIRVSEVVLDLLGASPIPNDAKWGIERMATSKGQLKMNHIDAEAGRLIHFLDQDGRNLPV